MSDYVKLDSSYADKMKKIKTTNEALNILEYYRHIDLFVKSNEGFLKIERLTQKAPKNMIKGDLLNDWEDPHEDTFVYAIDIGGVIQPVSDVHVVRDFYTRK